MSELGKPKQKFSETFSAATALKERFAPMTSHDDLIARAEKLAEYLDGAGEVEASPIVRDLTAALKECRERTHETGGSIPARPDRESQRLNTPDPLGQVASDEALLRDAMDALGPFVGVAEALNDAGRHGHGNYSEWVGKLQPIDFGQARIVADKIKERLDGRPLILVSAEGDAKHPNWVKERFLNSRDKDKPND